jgi:hypothetical protein
MLEIPRFCLLFEHFKGHGLFSTLKLLYFSITISAEKLFITRWGTLCPGEYRFWHAFLVDVRFPIVVDSHKIEY